MTPKTASTTALGARRTRITCDSVPCVLRANEPASLCSVAASGDGSVMLWDVALGEGKPIKKFAEHEHEVYSVDWNLVNKATPAPPRRP